MLANGADKEGGEDGEGTPGVSTLGVDLRCRLEVSLYIDSFGVG